MVHDVELRSRIVARTGGGVEEAKPDAASDSGAGGQAVRAGRADGRGQQGGRRKGGQQVPHDPGDDRRSGASLP